MCLSRAPCPHTGKGSDAPPSCPPLLGSWMLPWHGFLSSSNSPGILTSFQRQTVTVFKQIPAKILTKEENHFCLFPSGFQQPTPPPLLWSGGSCSVCLWTSSPAHHVRGRPAAPSPALCFTPRPGACAPPTLPKIH